MEIKGEEFIKNVKLKQDKREIEQKLNEFANYEDNNIQDNVPPRLDKEVEIQESQEYSDIMLDNERNNEKNKRKYLILGLILVIIFLLTVIIIRLLTDDDTSNNSFSKTTDIKDKKTLENENIEEQYQKIINEKLKNIKEENKKIAEEKEVLVEEEKIDEKLDLQKLDENEKIEEKIQEKKQDDFEDKQKRPEHIVSKKKPVEEKVVKKEIVVKKKEEAKTTPKTSTNNFTSKPKGTFVQVGAFSNMPSKKYLNNITNKGFKYRVYKVTIKNKLYHKVLVGPYSSKAKAKLAIDNIKKKLNVSGAFILTL